MPIQRRRRITGHTIVGALTIGATVYGGHLSVSGFRHRDWIRAVGGTTMLTIGAILGATLLIRHWLTRHSASMRRDLEAVTAERHALEDHARRIQRQTDTNALLLEGARRRHDDLLNQLSVERGLRLAAERNFHELNEDHNLLILETLQMNSDRFSRRDRTRGTSTPAAVRARGEDVAARGGHDGA